MPNVFHRLLARCNGLPGKHKFRFKNPLYSLDASTIDLSLKLFPWAAHRHDKASVKLSVGLNHGNLVPEFVALSDGQENDMMQGRQFDFPKGSIVAFDKGYVDYQWFKSLTDKGVFFVTRLRAKAVYSVLERRPVDRDNGVLSDQIIQLSSAHALKRGAPRLRRIGYLLVAYARYSARAGWTVQRMLRVIQLNLFERRGLKEILSPDPPGQKKGEPQMRFAL